MSGIFLIIIAGSCCFGEAVTVSCAFTVPKASSSKAAKNNLVFIFIGVF
jgi:hypothetical protein